jgi:hypothetical protein
MWIPKGMKYLYPISTSISVLVELIRISEKESLCLMRIRRRTSGD